MILKKVDSFKKKNEDTRMKKMRGRINRRKEIFNFKKC